MTSGRQAMGRRAAWALALCAAVVAAGTVESRADLSRPDAVVYGRVVLNGQPVEHGLLSARDGDVVLDTFSLGSDSIPERFGLAIPILQATDGIGDQGRAGLSDGGSAGIFLEDRLLTAVVVRSGAITRLDISAGQSRCNGGGNDGDICASDFECPGGFCVASRAICDGGGDDGQSCECIGGTCSLATACTQNAGMGTCAGGAAAGTCCDVALNCAGGAACAGTQRLCAAGAQKGQPCLRADHCPGSQCVSTGLVCNGGSASGFACVDGDDCPGGGVCSERIITPTPTPSSTPTPSRTLPVGETPATATPTPTETVIAAGCPGDCDGSGNVSISELIRLVNIALGQQALTVCPVGDRNGDERITINELITAVNRALNGCGE